MNIGTVCVLLVLTAIVIAILAPMVRRRKSGKFSCSGGCSGCSSACSCAGFRKSGEGSLTRLTLDIVGMSCGMCESHINDAIRRNFLIVNVRSSFRNNQTVILSALPIDEDRLKRVILDCGYRVCGIRTENAD